MRTTTDILPNRRGPAVRHVATTRHNGRMHIEALIAEARRLGGIAVLLGERRNILRQAIVSRKGQERLEQIERELEAHGPVPR